MKKLRNPYTKKLLNEVYVFGKGLYRYNNSTKSYNRIYDYECLTKHHIDKIIYERKNRVLEIKKENESSFIIYLTHKNNTRVQVSIKVNKMLILLPDELDIYFNLQRVGEYSQKYKLMSELMLVIADISDILHKRKYSFSDINQWYKLPNVIFDGFDE